MDCNACRNGIPFDIAMAFQPIVDIEAGGVLAYEALVRGVNGEGAPHVLGLVTPESRYAFDQKCRVTAIETAARLGIAERLSINFAPNAIYEPRHCLRSTLDATQRTGLAKDRLIFEFTEDEEITDHKKIIGIFEAYKETGLGTAIDDFGAGWSQLNLLAEIQPDFVKIDMKLVRNVHQDRARQAIIQGLRVACEMLGVRVIAEGIESHGEAMALKDLGIRYMQGYLFARPEFMALPVPADLASLAVRAA